MAQRGRKERKLKRGVLLQLGKTLACCQVRNVMQVLVPASYNATEHGTTSKIKTCILPHLHFYIHVVVVFIFYLYSRNQLGTDAQYPIWL